MHGLRPLKTVCERHSPCLYILDRVSRGKRDEPHELFHIRLDVFLADTIFAIKPTNWNAMSVVSEFLGQTRTIPL